MMAILPGHLSGILLSYIFCDLDCMHAGSAAITTER